MRIRTQFTITLVIFSMLLIVIAASIVITSGQVSKTRSQESLANNITQGAGDLSYLSSDYVIYHGSQQISQWQTRYTSFSDDVGNLSVDTSEQQALVRDIQANEQRMKTVFDSIVSTTENQNSNDTVSTLQVSWSRMSIQSQTVVADSTKLSQLLRIQVDQLNSINYELILAMIVVFGVFLVAIYTQIFRRTLKSISDLQAGTAITGSGDLDFKLKENRKDEIGELSQAFNQMTTNLKTVTASKADLEKAQTSLRASEQRWATTLSSIGDSVIATDVLGSVTFMNAVAEELTGWKLSEASGKLLKEVFHIINEETRQEVESPVAKVLEKGMIVGLANHTILVRKDGKEIPLDDSGAPIKDENGKVKGVVLVFHDISERKELERKLVDYNANLEKMVEERTKQLKDSERLAAIGATAGMVGHDIRNPLQAITSDVYLAKTELASTVDSEEKKNALESLDEIENNIFYINKIVADLQDYARPLNPVPKETNLAKLVDDILAKNSVPKNIKVQVKVEKEMDTLMADPDILKRILSNLVTNAVQAMPEGGKISIKAYKEADGSIITVNDTGVGIPEEVKEKLFTPLFTTKSKGQGFGLAVVKRMTESLGGTVTFESEQGKGTKFIIRLPPKS